MDFVPLPERKLLDVFPQAAVESGRVVYEFHCVLYNYFGRIHFYDRFIEGKYHQVNPVRDNYKIVIMGAGGPTGKSVLCKGLCAMGYDAVEISELANSLITYERTDKNYYKIDEFQKLIVVVLNERLRKCVN